MYPNYGGGLICHGDWHDPMLLHELKEVVEIGRKVVDEQLAHVSIARRVGVDGLITCRVITMRPGRAPRKRSAAAS